jgi:hypothetical protein
VAAQVVPAQVPHPTAFHWLLGHWLLGHWLLGHPSGGRGLAVLYAQREWLIRLIIYKAALIVISDPPAAGP